MIDMIRRSLLIGVGAAALTRDRIEQIISDSIARGELSTEQGKSLLDEMTQRAETERERLETFIRSQVDRALDLAGLASRTDLSRLEQRVISLETRLRDLSFSTSVSGRSGLAGGSESSSGSTSPLSSTVPTPPGEKVRPTAPGVAPIALDPLEPMAETSPNDNTELPPHM